MKSYLARLIGPMVSKARGKTGGYFYPLRCAADSAAVAAVQEDAVN